MGRIVIRFVERPDTKDSEAMIKWFCNVLGLSDDEGESIEEQMLKEFADAAYNNEGLSSSEIKLETPMARSTVIYHLNRFMDTGLVVKRGRKYYLRASEMSKAIEEIEYDIEKEMKRMLDTAREFDRLMGARTKRKKKVD
ncbi:MAG TPA: winged helix-turn-helix domain-containing protein [Candidatus Acidoferrales bacterium]|nr:winged helix-turn-helix domain-containing protein [Candidatus Acidoferrales bacterium]